MATTAQRVMEQYPEFAWLLRDPQVGALLAKATNPSQPWSDLKFRAELSRTRWYKRTAATVRQWQIIAHTDPAEATRRRDNHRYELAAYANSLGIQLTRNEMRWLTEAQLQGGYAPDSARGQYDLMKMVRGNIKQIGSIGTSITQLNDLIQGEWLARRPTGTVNDWGVRVAFGQMKPEDINKYMQKLTARWYPHLKWELAQGQTLRDIVEPRAEIMAQEYDTTPEAIYGKIIAGDPWLKQLIGVRNPKDGKTRLPSLAEVQKMARSHASWWNSTNGRSMDAQMATTLANVFGKRKSSLGG